ncbi:hypothetical protein MLD38_025508 [Melastoma candidum]|uniref:Uncharacterized protein n=1 Tax=Melastoma candidum TaxID=119954 RepID=A0ACB9NWZ7_9MYRT|nr:hypothetical protein MLD38_025508 [Melastoma candidum]
MRTQRNKPTMRRVSPYSSTIPEASTPTTTISGHDDAGRLLEEELSYAVLLSDRVHSMLHDAKSLKADCFALCKHVVDLSLMLRSLIRIFSSFSQAVPLYDRPVRIVLADVSANLACALSLARKCKRRNLIRLLCTIISSADIRKLSVLLESSVGDVKWVLSLYDRDGNTRGGFGISLPPIASNDPILAWVWSSVACLHMGKLSERVEAAKELASLAEDHNRIKKIIVEEGGLSPLLKLLKDGAAPDAQIAAAVALYNLSNDKERARAIVDRMGVPLIVQVLEDSTMRVQTQVARLVARMAGYDQVAQEEFAREDVIRPLVTLLSFETFLDVDLVMGIDPGNQRIHPIIHNFLPKSTSRLPVTSTTMHSSSDKGSSRHGSRKKGRENESTEVKLELKTGCVEALWMLARGNITNCKRITETKGLLCLAKLVEKERGELRSNCLMTLVEIAMAAESNSDLRRPAFKTNSPTAKAVVDQLLRLINEKDDPSLQVPAIRTIGCLARTFPARDTRVILPLVNQLDNRNPRIAAEAAISLGKFTCTDNFLCSEHSKVIIDSNGVPPLMKMLRANDKGMRTSGLVLLCNLARNDGDNEALRKARVLTALEGFDRAVTTRNPELMELISAATSQMKMYQAELRPQIQIQSIYLPSHE